MWPHSDYPLIEVGPLTLDRNATDFHTEMEQAAFEVNNLVPGITLSPDKMLLARGFSYADAHRARLGVNYKQIPVNSPIAEVHSYSKDGAMRIRNVSDPVYAPNSKAVRPPMPSTTSRSAGTPMVTWCGRRTRPTLRMTTGASLMLVREVMDDAARTRLVSNIVGHLLDGVTKPVLERAVEYWRNVDKHLGDRIEAGVRAKQEAKA